MQANLKVVHVVSAGSHGFHWSSSKELEDMAYKKIERLEMTTCLKNISVCIQEGDVA
jgi:hypothetical protein